MVNENDANWEKTDYIEDEQDSFELEDELEDELETDENDEISADTSSKKKKQMAVLLVLIIVLLVIGLFLIIKIVTGSSANNQEMPTPVPAVEVKNSSDLQNDLVNSFFEESPEKAVDMMSVGFNDNGEAVVSDNDVKNGDVATVADAPKQEAIKSDDLFVTEAKDKKNEKKEPEKKDEKKTSKDNEKATKSDNSIIVAWNKTTRRNPFKPIVMKQEYSESFEQGDGMQFEIIEPPTRLVPDHNIEQLLQTQISGILYDGNSPSAIVNISGRDEFVKIGDEVSGYKIKNITRNKVEISYKNNTYVASVGELFIPGRLEAQPAVVNLGNKFAGRYKSEGIEE